MSGQPRRHFTAEFKEQAVARLSEPGASQTSVAREFGVRPPPLKGWRLELAAAGSAEAVRRPQAEAAELAELCRENRRLREKVEVMRKGARANAMRSSEPVNAFFAQWAAKH
ncbi:transposase [Rhodovulum sulfidophilum]|uniref:transposase n=1 Tax=Rhodovulum sulfidophilum TaxID=35806 RepID=UPI001EED30FD|nr:transposase [Rhodovulum sulfidophilum]